MLTGTTYWIVGASEGLGRALAQALDAEGARLILSARSADRLDALAADLTGATALPMDVTDPASVAAAAEPAIAAGIGGIVYCAGQYEPARADDWPVEAVETMCSVNFTGAVRVLGQVVPVLARRNQGHVVLIGSLAGYVGLPGTIGYSSSKAALMHLGECLLADLRETGVRVQVINPGYIRTRLTAKNDFTMPAIMSPEDAAARVVAAMKTERFETRFPVPFAWLFTLGRLLPRRLFLRLF